MVERRQLRVSEIVGKILCEVTPWFFFLGKDS